MSDTVFFRSPAVPIVPGHYRVRYGSDSVVEISGDPRDGYDITGVSRVQLTDRSYHLPRGTLLAHVDSKGGNRYVGWHGNWRSGTATLVRRPKLVLAVDGDVLRGHGWEGAPLRRFPVVYRRIAKDEPSRAGLLTRAARLLLSPSRHSGRSEQ